MRSYGIDPLQLADLALKETHLILKFNQYGENLAKKHEQILENVNLLLTKNKKCYKKQVNTKKTK